MKFLEIKNKNYKKYEKYDKKYEKYVKYEKIWTFFKFIFENYSKKENSIKFWLYELIYILLIKRTQNSSNFVSLNRCRQRFYDDLYFIYNL